MENVVDLWNASEQACRAGDLPRAEAICRQILASDPRHAQALHLLGALAHQGRRPDLAVGFLRSALAIDPAAAAVHNSLGETLRALDRCDEAKDCFRRAIELDAHLAAAHYNLATICQQENDLPRAIAEIREALRLVPHWAEAHKELANLLREQGDLEGALEHFQEAIAARADFAEAYNDRGNVLQDLGRLDEAVASFEQALRLQPDLAAAHYNLGNALRAAGRLERAAACYREALHRHSDLALALNNLGATLKELGDDEGAAQALVEAVRRAPRLAEAHYNLATLLQKQQAFPAAQASFRRAIELDPRHALSHANLGSVCQALDAWDEARACFEEALRLDPDGIEARCNLGVWCTIMGRHAEALAHFDRVLALRPDCAEAHCNRGMLLLGEGNFGAGWPEYAWYSKCGAYYASGYTQPAWDGSPLEGRTILIVCDHGLGDTLQFVRCLPWVRRCGAGRILLAAQKSLHPLLAESGFGELVALDAPPPDFDVHVSSVMLPALLYAREQKIEATVPYLHARDELVAQWRQRLAEFDGFKIGICWHGSPTFPLNKLRSPPLVHFGPLAELPGVRLISLQHGEGRNQLAAVADRFHIVDLGDQVDRGAGAFMDTAAIIKCLDLVISSDTSTAHVAGALGAPVWLALAFAPEWRWMRHGDTSPWYPTMRLFRQTAMGDWPGVFERMASEARQLIGAT